MSARTQTLFFTAYTSRYHSGVRDQLMVRRLTLLQDVAQGAHFITTIYKTQLRRLMERAADSLSLFSAVS